ncbi:hypothetical protein MES5069_390063 [Mesorhizobium escarrei]|uniref:Uncharacterized protein n=1 Tax=Mesorhizobium escarrei TaxID=666018 RepID=A0ABM9E3A5_9HYPH|nr:hypothetical protein MES5069_390063 [Mesorhizobium escarrei]
MRIRSPGFSQLNAKAQPNRRILTINCQAHQQKPGLQVVLRWDTCNLTAETWLREHSAQLVTNIVADQQVAIRAAFSKDLARGANPTRAALEVVGRVNRVTGRREGGVIGLTTVQSDYVARARDELLSGEPDQLRAYLNRKRRDKRFDRTITAATRDGKPIPTNLVARIIGRYSDSLLKLRVDTIGLHETFAALGASKDIAFQQAIAKARIWHEPSDGCHSTGFSDRDNLWAKRSG